MTEPFTPEQIKATRVVVGQRVEALWPHGTILANELRWLATVEALQKRLDAAEGELARCWSVATETSPEDWPGLGATYTEVDKLDDRAIALEEES